MMTRDRWKYEAETQGRAKIVEESNANTVTIEVQSADRFFCDLNLNRLDLVKVDVEGHEIKVFNVAKEHLRRLHPRMIYFEDHAGRNVGKGGAIGSLLDEIGYDVFGVRKRLTGIEFVSVFLA